MCILFIFSSSISDSGDYSLILASNRDEYYDRPTQYIGPWMEDNEVFGGRDLQVGSGGGTWLAMSPSRKKIGVLLNLPGKHLQNAQSRGKIVADYVKTKQPVREYVDIIKKYTNECNHFVFVTAEFRDTPDQLCSEIHTYSNASDSLIFHTDQYLGFGNNLPNEPLKKVEAGRCKLEEICNRLNTVEKKEQLLEELIVLLKSKERHLPDPQLQRMRPIIYEHLSSIFVSIPELRYGTRTHTIILVTKKGDVDVIEITLQDPIDPLKPIWKKTVYNFNLL